MFQDAERDLTGDLTVLPLLSRNQEPNVKQAQPENAVFMRLTVLLLESQRCAAARPRSAPLQLF